MTTSLVVTAIVVLGCAGSAQATVDITALVAKPIPAGATCSTNTGAATQSQAGAHEDFCVALGLDGHGSLGGGDDMKDLKLSLPAGQVGAATATATCDASQFQRAAGCPSNTRVGEVSATADSVVTIPSDLLAGNVYNLKPRGTEAARLGLDLGIGPIDMQKIEVEIRMRPGDGGLDSISFNQPRLQNLAGINLPIEVRKLNLKLWGSGRGMNKSFMANPTDCTHPAVTRVEISSYGGDTDSSQTSYTPTGCDKVPFNPSMILDGDRAADAPGRVSTGVSLPSDDEPLAQAHIKRSVNILPEGVELSPASASEPGFVGCTDAEFGSGKGAPSTCPAGSKVGTVVFRSPLISKPVEGNVYLAEPTATSAKIRLFVVGELGPELDATRVKFTGVVEPDPATGQMRTTFDDLPATPFTEFRLTFRGGPTAITSFPRSCGTYTGQAVNQPWGSTTATTRSAPLVVDQNCNDPDPFAPFLEGGTSTTQAGADTAIITTLGRPDGHARLAGAKISMPTGLSGRLTAAPLCPVAQATAGTCGAESRVGSVTAIVGPGSAPSSLTGSVYISETYKPGGLAGLSIVVPAKLGPIDLGNLVVAAQLSVRPDTGLDIAVDSIPQRASGISTQVRSMKLTLDKPGFGVNATSCAAQTFSGTLFSDLGGSADVSSPYQPTGCESLPFSPGIEATMDGGSRGAELAENGHPALTTIVTQAPGNANNKTVKVTLPPGLAADTDRLKRACPIAQYEQGGCPANATVGGVKAWTPLLPGVQQGPVTFVSVPGAPLPELRAELRGLISVTLKGKITFGAGNRLVAGFEGIPDVPLSRFELNLEGGAKSLMIATRDLCPEAKQPFEGEFASHAGTNAKAAANATLVGCGPSGTLKLSSLKSGRPTLDLRVTGGRSKVTTAQLVLPKGLELGRGSAVKKRLKVTATGLKKGTKATISVTGSSLKVTVPKGQSASTLRVRVTKGGLKASTRLRKQGRTALKFSLRTTQTNDGRVRTATLRARPGG
ncbi:MAG: hypothetical protein JHC95_07730 [Solirubrobacteraceae bacterium]|nr:hypothetical protein [Solirubrobacteraceae bacterium]